jgi:hypothetical protein
MHKGGEITNVKSFHEFGNDPIKMCFEHKIGMKVNHKMAFDYAHNMNK